MLFKSGLIRGQCIGVRVVRDYLAETFVVKDTHWFTNVSGVEPVMSSHWAGVVPPAT